MPTREALKRLGFEGLVDFDRRAVTITMLSPSAIRELFTIRLRLESLATEWALPALDAETTAALRSVLDRMTVPGIGAIAWRELNRDFHQTFYGCGNSRYLLELIHNIWDRIQPYMAIYATAMHDFTEAER